MKNRETFPSISPSAWEHPADRAALSVVRAIPLAGDLVRRLVGSTTERSLRLSALAGGARVSDAQFPQVHRLVVEAARVLDLSPLPEVFVRLGMEPYAYTLGVEKPFIILSSAALDFWAEDELLAVIGHEMGHILSGHAVFKTLLNLVNRAQAALGEGLLGAAALGAVTAGLREWDRKSELSSDRASLLVVQDSQAVYRALMKTAGGPHSSDMDLNEFFRQAQDYDAASEGLDSLLKLLDLLGDSHPFPAVRMVELQEWEKGGAYESLLKGDYRKRGSEGEGGPADAFKAATDSYTRDFASSQDPLAQAAGKVMDAIGGILGGAGGPRNGGGTTGQGGRGGQQSVEDLIDGIFGKGRGD